MQPLLAFLFLLIVSAAVLPTIRSRRARRRRLADLAMRSGWTYTPSDPWDLPGAIEGLWLGAWGHDHRCRDVFSVPAQTGSLWLAVFGRQMSSGRNRRTESFALAVVRLHNVFGGIAVLPKGQTFVPADPFARYRPVTGLGDIDLTGRHAWAERPVSECHVLSFLAARVSSLPPNAALEVRGQWAAVYWPLARPATPQDFVILEAAGRRLLDLPGPTAQAPPGSATTR